MNQCQRVMFVSGEFQSYFYMLPLEVEKLKEKTTVIKVCVSATGFFRVCRRVGGWGLGGVWISSMHWQG
jgi:hypothetical protein